jgi:hypothetical protein
MYPLRCLCIPPGVRVLQVEYHWARLKYIRLVYDYIFKLAGISSALDM